MLTVAGYSLLHRMSNCGWCVSGSGSLRNFTGGGLFPMLSHRHGIAASVSAALALAAISAAFAAVAAGSSTSVFPVLAVVLHPRNNAVARAMINRFFVICKAGISVLLP